MDLKSIIFGKRRERMWTEGTEIGGIVCPLIKMNGWDTFIYGGGPDISAVILYFLNLGIHVKGVLDCDPKKEGKMILGEVPVINPSTIEEKFDSEKVIVIINTIYFKGIEQYEIVKLLSDLGVNRFYELSDWEKDQIKGEPGWTDVGRIEYYYEHFDDLQAVYETLYDEKSKKVMLEYIRAFMEIDVYKLHQCSGDVKYFYDQNADMSREEIYKHLEDEVWVNCGSATGDNIFWYFANGLKAKVIYAYEADEKAYARLNKNLKYLPEKYRKKVFTINEFIDEKTNWGGILNGDKITLINADVDGSELDLLKSMEEVIVSCRPVLAICTYHKAADLIDLPSYVKQIVKNYHFVLRKYETHTKVVRRTGELVLYAIPEERLIKSL